MVREIKHIDISDKPDVVRIAEEVQATREPRTLSRDGVDIAVVVPTNPREKRLASLQPVTRDDSLFRLVGIGEGTVPGGVSGKKHEHLARVYREL